MSAKHKDKDLDFEINLMPVLSVMSICICYLLTISVWNRMGMITVQQAIGDVLPSSGVNPATLLVKLHKSGNVVLAFRDGYNKANVAPMKIPAATDGKVKMDLFKDGLARFLKTTGTAKTVLVMPENSVPYGQTIAVMDILKSHQLNVGLAPSIAEEAL
jgi:biopolymer transport protein ExbD